MTAEQPPRPFAAKVLRIILLWFVLLPTVWIGLLVLGLTVALWHRGFFANAGTSSADRLARASVEIGLERTEVEQLFGRPPDYSCQLQSFTAIYFFDPMYTSDEHYEELEVHGLLPEVVESIDDLPDTYDAKQIMFDAAGYVIAFTHMKDKVHLRTILGDYPGYSLNKLPAEFFKTLSTQAD